MRERVVTKIGDVFRTNEGRLIQLVAIDYNQLNSDVVIVYKATALEPLNAVEPSEIDFYHHTTISEGVRQQLWEKIGKAPVPNLSNLLFKTYMNEELFSTIKTQPYWMIWAPNDLDCRQVTEKIGLRLAAEDGSVVPPQDIIYRINNGVSEFKLGWPL